MQKVGGKDGSGKRDKGKVLVFTGAYGGMFPTPSLITQSNLIEHLALQTEYSRAKSRYLKLHLRIRKALRQGVPVEEGLFSAELVPRHRQPVQSTDYEELIVR